MCNSLGTLSGLAAADPVSKRDTLCSRLIPDWFSAIKSSAKMPLVLTHASIEVSGTTCSESLEHCKRKQWNSQNNLQKAGSMPTSFNPVKGNRNYYSFSDRLLPPSKTLVSSYVTLIGSLGF